MSRTRQQGFLPRIRETADGEMKRVFAGEVAAEAGMKRIAERGKGLLKRFQSSVG